MKERLQKLMAQANVGSRRAAEELIEQGRVRVNGKVAHLGDKADPETDTIEVDGNRLKFDTQPKIYIAVYKPKHVVSSNVTQKDDQRRNVRELVPVQGHLFTVGRLDADSEGLVVLTNDGTLANRLSHPRYQHTKTYRVVVNGLPNAETIATWERGVYLPDEDATTAPAVVRIVKGGTDMTTLRIVMTEGRKRQIRRVAALLGHPVRRLIRTHIGMLSLGKMKPGDWHELTPMELRELRTPAPELRTLRTRAAQPDRRRRNRPEREDDGARTEQPRTRRGRADAPGSKRRREQEPRQERGGKRPAKKRPGTRKGNRK